MKAGDLVRHRSNYGNKDTTGLVVDIIQKKVARTSINSRVVNWDFIDPEPHAVVIWGSGKTTTPVSELEVTVESN